MGHYHFMSGFAGIAFQEIQKRTVRIQNQPLALGSQESQHGMRKHRSR
jgi:hypothetical protein